MGREEALSLRMKKYFRGGMAVLSRVLALLAVVAVGGCQRDHNDYPVGQFINDLYLDVTPRPAEQGERVAFFVQGEPPVRLMAHRYADLLTLEGEPLYRLDAAGPGGETPRPLRYPLPTDYDPPANLVALQTRQTVQLPADVRPGKYILQTDIVGVGMSSDRHGTPSWKLSIVSRPD